MLTIRLSVDIKNFAIVVAIPPHADGISHIYGHHTSDIQSMEAGFIDAGNVEFGGQEAMIVLEQVFHKNHRIFMDAEYEFASPMVIHCYLSTV